MGKKLWAWYSEVDGPAKTEAKAFLEKVERDNMIHEQLLTNFNTKLQLAVPQTAGAGQVAIDAKNYAAIVGEDTPVVGNDITQDAVDAHGLLQKLDAANQAKAKALAEARLYASWKKRFEAVASQFTGTSGFSNIVKCLKETFQNTAPVDGDANAGQSGWAVYSRVSADTKAKLQAAIVEQV